MFFPGSDYPESDGFDTFASIGIAWSHELSKWEWPASR